VGDLLVNNYSALPPGSALGQTIGNLLEVLVATWLLRRLARGRSLNADVGGVCRTLTAIAIGTAISATVGPLSLWLGGVVATGALPRVWRTWWLGDFSGALLVVPLALSWVPPRERGRWVELTLAIIAVVASSALAWGTNQPLTYIVFPALIWTAFRLGPRGATLAVLVAAGFAVRATTHYTGPFSTHSFSRGVLETQLFIAVASLSTQCLAAVVYERERFAQRLWASRARVVRAADTERNRLQRNLHDGAQQRLAALMVRLQLAADAAANEPPAHTQAALRAAQAQLAVAIDELRELAHGKHPVVLTERGLAAAIADIATRSAVPAEVLKVPARRLPDAMETTAYYVVAEAVANAQKHGRPSAIRVSADTVDGALQVEVEDDGIGGAVESPGSGLEGLRDRVEAAGGIFEVDSRAGAGTRIVASIPEVPRPT
jgi:signal transduction histidine kinase